MSNDMKALFDDIEPIIGHELDRANDKHPLFDSPHEGYAVIREEYEEAAEELIRFEDLMHNTLWKRAIRSDKPTRKHAAALYEIALKAAAECVQTAAMCKKYWDSIKD